ncbi:MAG: autotransporter-associated beta strand repeat-containing protein [Luteolibacter sp.]|uniref:beta strand repeat-containing protein n=1 Tax=Luteolibacter sp. TaxID=1962973 RepID=UPI0032672405
MKPKYRFPATLRNFRPSAGIISFIVVGLASVGLSQGAALTWDSGNTTNGATIDPGGGTWNTTAGNAVWNNATTNVIWSQTNATTATNSAIFGGADGGPYAITVGTALATSGLTFNNSGYTLSAASAQTINLSGPVLVATGKSGTIGSNVIVERTAASTLMGTTTVASGTLNIASGGTLRGTSTGAFILAGIGTTINVNGTLARTNTSDAASYLLQLAPGTTDDVTVNVESGGLLSVGGRRIETGFWGKGTVNVKAGGALTMTSATGGHIYAGFGNGTASGSGTINVTGGTVTTGTVGETIIGGALSTGVLSVSSGTWNSNGRMALAENGTGTVTLSDTGSISVKSTTAGVNFASGTSTAAVGTLNLNGGTLTTPAITKNTAGASATFNFNGGTLKPNQSNGTFMAGLNTANVHDNGAVFDTNSFNITVGQALTHSVLPSANAIDGGLTKNGAGTLTLSNTNTYTGPTSVTAGTLVPSSSDSLGTGAVTVSGGTLLLNNVALTSNTGISVGAAGTLKLQGNITHSLPLASAGAISLSDGNWNTLTAGAGISLSSSSLNFELLTGLTDQIAVTGAATVTGVNTINLSLIPAESLISGNYTLVSSTGGLNASNFVIGSRPPGFSTYTLSTPTANSLVLKVIAGNDTPATAYWTGLASGTGSPADPTNVWGYGSALAVAKSNWSTTSNGLSDPKQIPGSTTDVIFSATNATGNAGVLATKLEGAYTVNGVTFNVPVSTAITSTAIDTNASILTLGTGGLTIDAASNSGATINGSGSVVVSGDQSWSNNSDSKALTVVVPATAVQNSTTLTLNGNGTGGVGIAGLGNGAGSLLLVSNQKGLVTLSGPCTYTGTTTINDGNFLLENLGSFSSQLAINHAVSDALTFHQDTQNLVLPNSPITGVGGIVKTGSGSLTLASGSSSYEGGTVINAGSLLVNASAGAGDAEGQSCTVGKMAPGNVVTVNNGATLAINGTAPLGNSNQLPIYSPSLVVNAGGTVTGNAFVAFLPNLTLNGGTITVGAGSTTGGFNTNLGLVGTVTVSGSVPSSITTPVAGGNSRISLGAGAAGNNGVTFAVAEVTGNTDIDFTISSIIRNAGSSFVPLVSPLVKTGPGTMLLSAANTYTGSTTVQQGELILGAASLADASNVFIGATATLRLTHGVSDTVHALTIGGVQLPAGTYGAAGIANSHITGTGSLVVTSSPVVGYDDWSMVIPDVADRDRTDDPDGDGFSNLNEYLFGTSPIASNGSLSQSTQSGNNLIVRWSQRNVGTFVLQESSTLLDNPWPASAVTVGNAADQTGLYSADYIRKEAIVPIDSTRKFVRVKGEE